MSRWCISGTLARSSPPRAGLDWLTMLTVADLSQLRTEVMASTPGRQTLDEMRANSQPSAKQNTLSRCEKDQPYPDSESRQLWFTNIPASAVSERIQASLLPVILGHSTAWTQCIIIVVVVTTRLQHLGAPR